MSILEVFIKRNKLLDPKSLLPSAVKFLHRDTPVKGGYYRVYPDISART